jgi:hypothetical protein
MLQLLFESPIIVLNHTSRQKIVYLPVFPDEDGLLCNMLMLLLYLPTSELLFPLPFLLVWRWKKYTPWWRDLSAEEKAAKDKRTRELITAYRNRQNMVIDAKTRKVCNEVLIQTLHLS